MAKKAKYTREERKQFQSGAVADPRGKVKPQLDPNERALQSLYGVEGANAGNALINKFLPEGALGRVSTNLPGAEQSTKRYSDLYNTTQGRSAEQETTLANMKAGLGGYTSPEYQAQREQMQRGLNSNMATSSSALAKAQARGKVYGAAASAQQNNLIRGAQDTKDSLEQDLYIKNIDEMDRRNLQYGEYGRGLDEEEFGRRADATKLYGDEAAGLRAEELEREKVNLGQTNAELAAQIGAYTGAGATALAQQNTLAAQDIQREGIRAVTSEGGGGGGTNAKAHARVQAKANKKKLNPIQTIAPITQKGPANIKKKNK